MFAIYEVLEKHPSGKPEKQWSDWCLRKGKAVEKRLLGTRGTQIEAQQTVEAFSKPDSNEVYYINIDGA